MLLLVFFPRSPPIADETALVATDDVSDDVSRPAMDPKVLRTEFVLDLVTRLLDPEIRFEMNDAGVLAEVAPDVSPLTLVIREMMLLMLLVLPRSSFPSALYCV